MKLKSTRLFRSALFVTGSVAALLAGHSALADTITGTGWLGGASSSWANGTNWTATGPSTGGSGDRNLFFGTAWKAAGGTGSMTANNDLTAWAGYRITFDSITGPVTFTLTGNAITLYDFGAANFPKIENLSTVVQNVNLAVALDGTNATGQFAEIDPTNGDLSFGSTVDLAGITQLRVYGATGGKTLTFNGAISSSGNSGNNSVAINSNNIVVYKAANTYAGDTFINAGRLEMASGSSIATSQIQLGDTAGTAAAEFRLTQNGGYDFNRNVTVRNGSSGVKTINSTNTTGTNTISGTITFNSSNTIIKASPGGTLAITTAIAGTSGGGLIVAGGGTVNITGGGSIGGGASNSYFSVDSGTLNVRTTPLTTSASYRMSIGWNTATPGVLNVDGTSLTLTANTEVDVGAGYNGVQTNGTGTINIGGTVGSLGLLDLGTTTGAFKLGAVTGGTGSGTLNLNAYGTLATSRVLSRNTLASSGMVNFDGGTFKLTGTQANMIDTAIVTTIKGGGATIDTNNFAGTLNSALLAGTGSGGLTKIGTNTLTLGGASTYVGATAIRNGTLALGTGNDRLPTTTTLTLGDGATNTNGILKLDSRSQTLAGLLTAGLGASNSVVNGNVTAATLTLNIASGTNTFGGLLGGVGTNENNFALTKSGNGILELTAANTFSGGTSLGGGTLKLSGGNNRLVSGSAVTFTAASTLDVGSTSQTLNTLTLLGAGQTNTISGSGGTLIFNAPSDQTWTTTATGTTVDMSGLSNFTFNGLTRSFQINSNAASVVNTVKLAKAGTNTINATNVRFGGGGNVTGQNVLVGLGQNNNINASGEFVIGYFQGRGDVSFQSGLTNPVLTVRGAGGSGATPLMTVGSTNSGNQPSTGILNLTNGSLDVLAADFYVARHFANAGGTNSTGTVTMPAGTVVATTLNLAAKTGATTGAPTLTGTFNQSGGNVTATTVNLGLNTNTELPNLIANYNLTGGTLFATTIQGFGATYDLSTVRNLTINGGTLRNLAGGDLSVNGLATTATGRINIIAGASGANFNADATRTIIFGANTVLSGGAVTKSGAGILALGGNNTYTGLTTVSDGGLNVGSASSLASGNALTLGASGTADFANAGQNLGAVINGNTATNALNFSAATGTVTLASLTGAGNTRFGSNGIVTGGISSGTVTSVGNLAANISGGNTTVGGVATIGTMSSGTANLNGGASSIGTLNGGTVNLGTTALTVDNGTTSGSITGAGGSLSKATGGTLTLSGANSYDGGTTLSAGSLILSSANAAGTGGIAVSGASTTLEISSGITLANATNDITVSNTSASVVRKVGAGLAYNLGTSGDLASDLGGTDTTAKMLAGTNSGSEATLTMSFSDTAPGGTTNDAIRRSDVFSVSGTTGSDLYVLQLSASDSSMAADSVLGWNNGTIWDLAINGNSGTNTTNTSYLNYAGSFSAFQTFAGSLNLADYQGAYGIDTSGGNRFVWAVVNHGGSFTAVPEPTSALAGLLITAGLLRRRRR